MKAFASPFAVVSGSLVLSLVASVSMPVQAAVISQAFTVDVTEGDLAGETYSGSFSYEESLLDGVGLENLSAGDGLTLNFNFLGTIYTEADDFSFDTGLLPEVSFLDGLFYGLSYLVETPEVFFVVDDGNGGGLPGTTFTYELGAIGALTDSGSGQLQIDDGGATVPEPATLVSLLLFGTLGANLRKRTAA